MSSTTVRARGFRNFAGAVGIGWLCLAVAACGGGGSGDSAAPSADAIEACLAGAGLAAQRLEAGTGVEAVAAQAPDGDDVFVINVPGRGYSSAGSELIKKEVRKLEQGRIVTTATVNEGLTLVAVMGVKGVGGGAPSASTEILARQCATKPQRAAKAQGTSTSTEA